MLSAHFTSNVSWRNCYTRASANAIRVWLKRSYWMVCHQFQEETAMKRVGFVLQVRKDKIEEYKAHHKKVWPEMLEALRRNGWHNYSLFLRDDGLLFGYFETPESFQAALAGMAKEEINTKWQEFMAPYFENLGGAHADQSMVELEEVFHLD
jgi:L-rhamnose mutarotase